jgi:hypothetical protein
VAFFAIVLSIILLISTAYLFYKWSFRAALVFIPVIVLLIYTGDLIQLKGFFVPMFFGAVGGMIFHFQKSLQVYLVISTLTLTILMSGLYYYQKQYRSFDELIFMRNRVISALTETKNYFKTQNTRGTTEQKKDVIALFDEQLEIVKNDNNFKLIENIHPLLRFVYYIFLSGLGYGIMRLFFSRLKDFRDIPGLEDFQLNEYIIFGLILGVAAIVYSINVEQYTKLFYGAVNVTVMITCFYALQGIGLVKFFLLKRGLPIQLLVFFLVVISLLPEIFIFNVILLAGFGSLDVWADFRKRVVKSDTNSED